MRCAHICYLFGMTSAQVTDITPRQQRDTVAAPIRAHLAVRNISGSDLARRIGLTQPQVSRRLHGRLPFTSDDLVVIAEQLDITIVELLQMPKSAPVGGGVTFLGEARLRRGWKTVGPEGLEPPASSVQTPEVATDGVVIDGPWKKQA
jgi:transcriptional regulator with XRE-family HTH domain